MTKEFLKIIDLAVKLEKQATVFYSKMRNETNDFNMQTFLNALLEKEIDHLASVIEMKRLVRSKKKSQFMKLAKNYKIVKLKNPFNGRKDIAKPKKITITMHDVFKQAVILEEKAHDFYIESSKQVSDKTVKAYLKKLAKEELQHKEFILEHEDAIYNDGYWLGIEHVALNT